MPIFEEKILARGGIELHRPKAAPDVAPAKSALIYYDHDLGGLYTSKDGGAYSAMADLTAGGVTASAAELNTLVGITASAAELNKTDGVVGSLVEARQISFTETSGAGVYTGSVTIPAGATILDVIVNGVALWNPVTSATLKVGDVATDDGYFTGVDLMATDLLAGESLSFSAAGGKAGAYIANSQVSPRYSASARTLSGIITTVGGSGSTGRTRIVVWYVLPQSTTAATKA